MNRSRKRGISNLGIFHREATARGLTYAEAQMQETLKMTSRVRAPEGKQEDGRTYSKISDRKN
ncbi:MAG: hypothetical protein NC389_09690 [Acetatifactor muris]|nr:hypothetical protein [Acetatifactor muris]